MNGYITSSQVAEKWGVTERYVQILCKDGKLIGAIKFGNTWAIPENVRKPSRLSNKLKGV